jgi:uncharacterized protein
MEKFIAITGASSGIGYATAKEFARRGKNLIVIARNTDKLEQLRDEVLTINSSLQVIIKDADLSQKENVFAVYDSIKDLDIELWINNAGFGDYNSVDKQDIQKMETMLGLNVEAVAIFSTLFTRDHKDSEGAQLINISSVGGYTLVPNAVMYCATKYFVSAFTEGLSHELSNEGAKMLAKVLGPAATKTNFGNVANNIQDYDYDKAFGTYHTCEQIVGFLLQLYESNLPVGLVNRETFEFNLCDYQFSYAGNSNHNQKVS